MKEKTYELNTISGVTLDAFDIEELAFELAEVLSEDSDEVKSRRLEALCSNTHAEANVREQYSGRGMYGKNCVGIVTSNPVEVIELAAQVGITGAKMDSMGMDTIVYWPKIQFVEES